MGTLLVRLNINFFFFFLEDKNTEFFRSKFKILHTGLSNYNERTICEGLYIKLYKPELNEQVIHRKILII